MQVLVKPAQKYNLINTIICVMVKLFCIKILFTSYLTHTLYIIVQNTFIDYESPQNTEK